MIFGYDFNGILVIIGRMVIANNRMSEDLQQASQLVEQLKKDLDAAKAEIDQLKAETNGRLESTNTH